MKILNKLTIKHLKSNPKRTVVSIIGIILSTALMVGIGLLFSSIRDMSVQMVERESGKHHAIISMDKSKLDIISKNQNVKDYSYKSSLGFAKYDGILNEYKPYIHVLGTSENYLENLVLKEGRLPNNENEVVISEHLYTNGGISLKVGDKLVLNLGKRYTLDGIELIDNPFTDEKVYDADNDTYYWIKNEEITDIVKREYTIVGICERDVKEKYSNPGYSVFTYGSADNLTIYVTYKNIKDTFKHTHTIASNLGYKEISENRFKEVVYNDNLLSINGVSNYKNVTNSLGMVICIILGLVSIACIIVIYNSFAISVMERKKQFGLFSSIGTTKKQLRFTVFYEAFIVGLIGIPLGILSAYIGIGVVIAIIKNLLPFEFELRLVTYPLFIIIPVVFMIITILISAYLPAKRASRVSPIEAIRQNDDIKIKSKKVKSPKFIRKMFKVEGDIAYKNIKRNKKKYRITIISLFISIVLFISFSSLIKYGLESAVDFTNLPEYEYIINVTPRPGYESDTTEAISKIISIDAIKKYTIVQELYLNTDDLKITYTEEAIKNSIYEKDSIIDSVRIISLDNKSYNAYKKELGLKDNRPIVINKYEGISYTSNSRKAISINLFKEINDFNISFYDYNNDKLSSNKYQIKNAYLADKIPMGLEGMTNNLNIIVDDATFQKICTDELRSGGYSREIFLVASKYDDIDKMVSDLTTDNLRITSYNLKEEMQLVKNLILVVKILLYGFISLVTLIGVTSVLNTINTSIALRRKEFAVLRSIGLTPKGFNRILFFESLFFGLKSLFYGIPVGILVTLLLHISMSNIVDFDNFMIPYGSIIISIIGVFIIVIISMWYATRKIKKENILNAIREENI